jgi:hypothetical protein
MHGLAGQFAAAGIQKKDAEYDGNDRNEPLHFNLL